MARFDFRSAIEAMTSVAQGELAGKLQGELAAQEQNNRNFGMAMNIAQMQDQQKAREMDTRGQIINLLGKQAEGMDPESQAAFYTAAPEFLQTGRVANPHKMPAMPPSPLPGQAVAPLEAMAGTGLVPGLMPGMATELGPQPVQPVARTPLGDFGLQGVSKKDISELAKSHQRIVDLMSHADPNDPNTAAISSIMGQVNLNPTSREELQQSRNFLSQIAARTPGLRYTTAGAANTAEKEARKNFNERYNALTILPPDQAAYELSSMLDDYDEYKQKGMKIPAYLERDREAIQEIRQLLEQGNTDEAFDRTRALQSKYKVVKVSSLGESNAAMANFIKNLKGLSVKDLGDMGLIRTLAKNVPALANMDDEELRSFARGRADEEFKNLRSALLKVTANTPIGQIKKLIKEANAMGQVAGRTLTFTPEDFQILDKRAQVELQKAQLARETAEIEKQTKQLELQALPQKIQDTHDKARADIQRTNQLIQKGNKQGGKIESSVLTTVRGTRDKAWAAYDRYVRDKVRDGYLDDLFDPNNTVPADESQADARRLWIEFQDAEAKLNQFLKDNGYGKYNKSPAAPRPKTAPKPKAAPKPEPKGFIQQAGEALRGVAKRFSGGTKANAAPKTSPAKAAPKKKKNKYEGMKDDAFLRARPGL